MSSDAQLFTIGEMAGLYGVNVQTLRYYDSIGLFCPAERDEITGYRYYCADQFEELNTIRYLRRLDLPIREIQSIMKERNLADILVIFEKQCVRVRERMAELSRIERNIGTRIEQITSAMQSGDSVNKIKEKKLPARRAIMLKRNIASGEDLELPIRLLEQTAHLQDSIFLGKIGLSIARDYLVQRDVDAYHAIFLLLEDTDQSDVDCRIIPEGTYVCMMYNGTHAQSAAHYLALLDHCDTNALWILGDSVEITYIDYGLTSDTKQFMTEIQLLVAE